MYNIDYVNPEMKNIVINLKQRLMFKNELSYNHDTPKLSRYVDAYVNTFADGVKSNDI